MPDLSPDQAIPALLGQRKYPNPTDLPPDQVVNYLQGQPDQVITPKNPTAVTPQQKDWLKGAGSAIASPVTEAYDVLKGRKTDEEQRDYFSNALLGTIGSALPVGGKMLGAAAMGLGAAAKGAEESAGPFYSGLSKAIQGAKMEKATPQQWVGYLKNQPGIKAEEMNWVGLGDDPRLLPPEWKGAVSKQDLHDWVNAHNVQLKDVVKGGGKLDWDKHPDWNETLQVVREDNPELTEQEAIREARHVFEDWAQKGNEEHSDFQNRTKYSSYQLPGGTNYQERLLTMPPQGEAQRLRDEATRRGYGDHIADWSDQNFAQQYRDKVTNSPVSDTFKSPHWDEPNVLAHVRYNDRDINGQKSLFLEEMQSDWHQKGREGGYSSPDYKAKVDVVKNPNDGGAPFMVTLDGRPNKAFQDMQEAHNWADELKSKAIGGVVPDAPFKTSWPDLTLKRMIHHAATNGYDSLSWTPGEVQEARYPGSKHQWFYDRDLVNKANDIGKKYGARVEQQPLSVGSNAHLSGNYETQAAQDLDEIYDRVAHEHPDWEPGSEQFQNEILDRARGEGPTQKVHVLPITPKLREAAKKGFPMFAAGGLAVGADQQASPEENQRILSYLQKGGGL